MGLECEWAHGIIQTQSRHSTTFLAEDITVFLELWTRKDYARLTWPGSVVIVFLSGRVELSNIFQSHVVKQDRFS
ncbi:hypothetical protein CH063_08508 [Colletotrichum higginsianum]|uniref:Uncharacterized protein n=1 Tax=Colletotrichum higginsianum (strain IMI 349063) TaxID=759273 RepID=H1VA34_COLHI|nr:hypothetical protein CH63R_11368 [Colletotrichum higginsianum IMI 349063]OBR04665.1 hypothetical protein CH63R_11368 [Colletotrichum higginsianum IMI 349063]CCF37087.1 hypothetical protein CH063_08508 [Colletotrichum higginsianum]